MTAQLHARELRGLVPLGDLTPDNLQELLRKSRIETLAPGRKLFKQGERDDDSVYLLEGRVELKDASGEIKHVSGGTEAARFPLDHQRPRQSTATVRSEARVLRVDNNLLDVLLTWDQNAGYVVTEIDDDGEVAGEAEADWMVNLLRARVFHRIPPQHIQAIFMRMEPVPVKAEQVVIRQGERAEYYYLLREGECAVIRSAPETGNRPQVIARLHAGEGFGEDALVSNSPRNATVKMLTDGMLMRLSKQDFEALLKEPLLHAVGFAEAERMVDEGARWLDVRLRSEHEHKRLPGSVNLPLYLLRLNIDKLDPDRKYIVYCDTGRRSASAAYILNEFGLNACVLSGGLMGQTKAANG